jgi:membrane associated rhomboid family serine protease
MKVVNIIIALNILVFLMWIQLGPKHENFMLDNFLISWDTLREGRYWALIGSAFSHNMLWHLFLNMFVFLNFGIVIEQTLGSLRFLLFYLFACTISSLSHSVICAFILHQPELLALGASGAVSAVILLFALFYPQHKVYFFGFIPLPAIWAVVVINGLDFLGLVSQAKGTNSPIGYGAHLGGAFSGLIYYLIFHSKFYAKRSLTVNLNK